MLLEYAPTWEISSVFDLALSVCILSTFRFLPLVAQS